MYKTCEKLFYLMLIIVFSFVDGCNTKVVKRSFDSHMWKEGIDHRHEMIDDLVKNHLKKEMKKDDVLEMLGEPDCTSNRREFSDAPEGVEEYLEYNLALTDDCFDCNRFRVGLDIQGRVKTSHQFKN